MITKSNKFDLEVSNLRIKVKEYFNLDYILDSNSRKYVKARDIMTYIMRIKFKMSFPIIGYYLKKDHVSVMVGLKRSIKHYDDIMNIISKLN